MGCGGIIEEGEKKIAYLGQPVKYLIEVLGVDGSIKLNAKLLVLLWRELGSSGSGYGQVAGCGGYGHEP